MSMISPVSRTASAGTTLEELKKNHVKPKVDGDYQLLYDRFGIIDEPSDPHVIVDRSNLADNISKDFEVILLSNADTGNGDKEEGNSKDTSSQKTLATKADAMKDRKGYYNPRVNTIKKGFHVNYIGYSYKALNKLAREMGWTDHFTNLPGVVTGFDSIIKQYGQEAIDRLNPILGDIYASVINEEAVKEGRLSPKVLNYMKLLKENTGKSIASTSFGTGTISFEYGRTVCDVDENLLEFMADHRGQQAVWDNMVKGKYKNLNEVYEALIKEGSSEVADALMTQIEKYEPWRIGDDETNFKTVNEWHSLLPGGGEPESFLGGESVGKRAAEPETKGTQIERLRKKLREIEKQMQEIQETNLPEEKKHKMREKFAQEIQTIQLQINDLLDGLAEEANG